MFSDLIKNNNLTFELIKEYSKNNGLEYNDNELTLFYNDVIHLKNIYDKIDYGEFDIEFIIQENQVNYLKTLFQPEQRTDEWYKLRMNMITASEAHMTLRKNINPYILKKCGKSTAFTGNTATRWGQQYEDVATMIYEKWTNRKVYEFGLIQHPEFSFIGASPDGITNDGRMVEIKCPYSRKLNGKPLHHYWIQTQIQLEVCDLNKCDFFECTIKEYEHFKDWINQLNNPYKECGVMVGLHHTNDPDKRIFYYCPLDISKEDMIDWVHEYRKKYLLESNSIYKDYYFKEHWWILKEVSLNTIHRDKQWFNYNIQIFKDTWKKVEHYKEHGCDDIIKNKKTFHEYPKIFQEQCMMIDSDSDDD